MAHRKQRRKKEKDDPVLEKWIEIPQLYGSPQILHNEPISSWIWRIAAKHHCTPSSIADCFKWNKSTDLIDFPSKAPDRFLIAMVTLNPVESISRALAGNILLSDSRYRCLTSDPFLTDRPIYRYCPSCLREDDVMHARISWRIASSWMCHKHYELLRDSCPGCGRFINLSIGSFSFVVDPNQAVGYCSKCLSNLAMQEPITIPVEWRNQLILFQTRMYETIRLGYFRHSRLGMISAKMWLRNYLTYDDTWKGAARYTGINLSAALLQFSEPLRQLWSRRNQGCQW